MKMSRWKIETVKLAGLRFKIIFEKDIPPKGCYNCTHFIYSRAGKGLCLLKLEAERRKKNRNRKNYYVKGDELCPSWRELSVLPVRFLDAYIIYDYAPEGCYHSDIPGVLSFQTYRLLVRYVRDRETCQVCGAPGCETHHIIPKCLGGSDHFRNLILLCHECHQKETKKLYPNNKIHVTLDEKQRTLLEYMS